MQLKKKRYSILILILGIALVVFFARNLDDFTETAAAERPLASEFSAANQRLLPFTRAHNFRDLGGYQTLDGRTLKWGLMYRSSKLSELTDQDGQYLSLLGLKTIIDFRNADEKSRDPNALPANAPFKTIPLPIDVAQTGTVNFIDRLKDAEAKDQDMSVFMLQANRDFVNTFSAEFRQFIDLTLEQDRTPLVFHCTAGKDRTGFAAAIFLLALGVPRETVMEDYLLSNQYSKASHTRSIALIRLMTAFQVSEATIKPLFEVRRSYLEAALNEIDRQYGSVDNYLEQELGLDAAMRENLREKFLM